ncbi:MAG: hypothetical protein NC548_62890 [Lachnospiraceae bacterium]|nr:hypothetical protein [Lachnospiraceae bacterium]
MKNVNGKKFALGNRIMNNLNGLLRLRLAMTEFGRGNQRHEFLRFLRSKNGSLATKQNALVSFTNEHKEVR